MRNAPIYGMTTLEQAKARWKTWSKSMLTSKARKSYAKSYRWTRTVNGSFAIVSETNLGTYVVAFGKDERGRVVGLNSNAARYL